MSRRPSAAHRQRLRRLLLFPGVVCHLCGKEIDLDIEDPYADGYGTLDHVIPVARGGSHAVSNHRPAHFGCNRKRQARDLADVAPKRTSRAW